MADNHFITVSEIGQIHISEDIVALIAGTAALEIEGAVLPSGPIPEDIAGMFGRRSLGKGVKLSINENLAVIEITLSVKMGYPIADVCAQVQSRVKTAVETMTGLDVAEVNVVVSNVLAEKEPPKPKKNNQQK